MYNNVSFVLKEEREGGIFIYREKEIRESIFGVV